MGTWGWQLAARCRVGDSRPTTTDAHLAPEVLRSNASSTNVGVPYISLISMLADELKKGTTPMLILALLEAESRHGYELSKLLEQRTRGVVRIHAASLYPLLYRLDRKSVV